MHLQKDDDVASYVLSRRSGTALYSNTGTDDHPTAGASPIPSRVVVVIRKLNGAACQTFEAAAHGVC
uniref:Uncharacterized protein n=1 Tax=Oryza meridionalis TaxID=40149 RepID=A0A0E0BW11_9ORYZ